MLCHPKRYFWAYDSRNSYLTLTSPIPPDVQVVDSAWNRERKEKNKQTNKQTTTTTKQQKERKKKKGVSLALLPYSPSSFFLLTSLSRSPLSGRLKRARSHQSLSLTQMTVSCAQLWRLPFRLVTQSFLAVFKENYVRSNRFVFFFIKCTCRQKRPSDLILFL